MRIMLCKNGLSHKGGVHVFMMLSAECMKPFKHWPWLSERLPISVAPGWCTMALPHVVILPGSMQVGQHSPGRVKGKWQCAVGQVISSQTTRPPVQRQVTQGLGDQTAWSNMVRPWYTHWPCLPETSQTLYSQFSIDYSSKSFVKSHSGCVYELEMQRH